MSSSKGSPSTTTMSLPSIHEMFPDHLLPKYESPRPHSHRGYSYPHPSGVHHTANHRDRAHEPQCACTHTGCLRHTDDRHLLSQQLPQGSPSSSSKRRPLLMPHSSQNIYTFNVLRSSPSSASLPHVTSSSSVPNRPANPQQLGPKSVVGSGNTPTFRVEGDVYPNHGSFYVQEGFGNEEEDDGNSGIEDNDTSNGKKHVCPTCFKRFNRPSSLRIHVNTHTGATPFRCPWPNCGREFNVNSNMRRHYRNHTTPGFSRSQSANNQTANSNANNNSPTDGRRKRRRVNIPASQIPPSGNGAPATGSHPYPPGQGSHRSEYRSRNSVPSHPHNPPEFSQPQQLARSSHPLPHTTHRGTNAMPSPPISTLSMSEEDSSSGSESDMESGMRYGDRTASLAQSLARVAVAPSHRNHPYSPYQSRGRSHSHYSQLSPTHQESYDALHDSQRRLKAEHVYAYERPGINDFSNPRRPLTPGSSFHSSSPSPSVSPSSHPSPSSQESDLSPPTSSSQLSYQYNASTPYVRSLADSRVSTTLRPAFAGSNEREKVW